MSAPTFLGKTYPATPLQSRRSSRLTKMVQGAGIGYMLVALLTITIALNPQRTQTVAQPIAAVDPYGLVATRPVIDFSYVPQRTLADAVALTPAVPIVQTIGGTTPTAPAQCDLQSHNTKSADGTTVTGSNNALRQAFNANKIFPLIPSEILSGPDCSPPFWNLGIFQVLIYKALALLNYLLEIAAILLTLYAGVLYLTGFASEANTTTAKKVLISTYTGLVIALSARLILGATIGVFSDADTKNAIQNGDSSILNGANPGANN